MTFTPAPCSQATSAQRVSNLGLSGGSSFSVMLPGPSFRWIAATMTWVTPVLFVINGSSEIGSCGAGPGLWWVWA